MKTEEKIERRTHTLDVTGKALGRVANEIAILLQGKNKPTFVQHKDMGDFVEVKNASRIKFTGKKFSEKSYFYHSGYLGSDHYVALEKIFKRDPGEVLRRAVMGMLPKNKLRRGRIKRLRVEA